MAVRFTKYCEDCGTLMQADVYNVLFCPTCKVKEKEAEENKLVTLKITNIPQKLVTAFYRKAGVDIILDDYDSKHVREEFITALENHVK